MTASAGGGRQGQSNKPGKKKSYRDNSVAWPDHFSLSRRLSIRDYKRLLRKGSGPVQALKLFLAPASTLRAIIVLFVRCAIIVLFVRYAIKTNFKDFLAGFFLSSY